MRTYLVVIDGTEESEVALRFAARRAAKTGGAVEILVIVHRADFVAFGGVQATIDAEARAHADEVIRRALEMLGTEEGIEPAVKVKNGPPVAMVHEALAENEQIAALVLGAAASGNPGPLVSHFAGADSGALPCPVMIVPGSLTLEAIDRLS